MTTTATFTDSELHEKRAAILSGVGLTYDELKERAEQYSLVGDERRAWEDLQSIAFLLGEE